MRPRASRRAPSRFSQLIQSESPPVSVARWVWKSLSRPPHGLPVDADPRPCASAGSEYRASAVPKQYQCQCCQSASCAGTEYQLACQSECHVAWHLGKSLDPHARTWERRAERALRLPHARVGGHGSRPAQVVLADGAGGRALRATPPGVRAQTAARLPLGSRARWGPQASVGLALASAAGRAWSLPVPLASGGADVDPPEPPRPASSALPVWSVQWRPPASQTVAARAKRGGWV